MKKILKKVLCTFLFFQLLSITGVYAGVQEFMEKALNSWVGYHINDMINSWGFPTDEKTIANRHIYIWNKAWSQYIPQRTNSTVTPGFYNATVNSYTTGGYNINWYCNKTIEVDSKNNITSWSWEGNACPKNYSNGKGLVNPSNDEWERERLRRLEEKRLKKLQKEEEKLEKRQAKELKKKEKLLKKEQEKEVIKEVSSKIK